MTPDFWFLAALLCAFFYGLQSAYIKTLMGQVHYFLITWSMILFSIPLFYGLLMYKGVPVVQSEFYLYLLISLSVNFLAWPLFVLAIHHSDISLVVPLLALTPVFVLGIEWLFRQEFPGVIGLIGIILIVSGAYVLNIQGIDTGLLTPFKNLFQEKGALYMLVVAIIWSISATAEWFTVEYSSPAFYLLMINCLLAILFIPLLYIFMEEPIRTFRTNWTWLPLCGAGVITGLMGIFQMLAIQETPLVNYVVSIKRSGMLVSVLLGWLYFGEKHIFFRAIGAVMMVGGVFLIKLQ